MRTRRFHSEVEALRVLGEVGCPHIVRVIDSDLTPAKGQPWFVMHYFAAGAMWEEKRNPRYLEQYRGNIDRVLSIARNIGGTLAFMHDTSGQVHRDVKCGNIFFDEVGGSPTLGDFGLVYSPGADLPETAVQDRLGPGRWRPPEFR